MEALVAAAFLAILTMAALTRSRILAPLPPSAPYAYIRRATSARHRIR